MEKLHLFIMLRVLFILLSFNYALCFAQHKADSGEHTSRIIIVPYQSMMYFSDADADIAMFSNLTEYETRTQIRNKTEANVYHQLLSGFDAISLMRATSLNGEEDLKNIYAATRYTIYSKQQKETYQKDKGIVETAEVKSLTEKFIRKSRNQTFWINDSSVMLADIRNPDIFKNLYQKHHEDYILFITQFEINTGNKNTIEWQKQDYKRTYTLHYNLFDKNGALLRAETLTTQAGNENKIKDINSKYLVVLAQRLKEIITATSQQ